MAITAIDIPVGFRSGRVTVLGRDLTHPNKAWGAWWKCRCDCGVEKSFMGSHLRHQRIMSCGCSNIDNLRRMAEGNVTHGHARKHGLRSLTHRIWTHMKQRCLNPNTTKFKNYGGRGVSVCHRWLTFENFLADMGECPKGLTIDRYPDNNGNYEPGNCRWATDQQQRENRRDTVLIKYQGVTMCGTRWAEKMGLKPRTLLGRIQNGWTIEAALTTPPMPHNKRALGRQAA